MEWSISLTLSVHPSLYKLVAVFQRALLTPSRSSGSRHGCFSHLFLSSVVSSAAQTSLGSQAKHAYGMRRHSQRANGGLVVGAPGSLRPGSFNFWRRREKKAAAEPTTTLHWQPSRAATCVCDALADLHCVPRTSRLGGRRSTGHQLITYVRTPSSRRHLAPGRTYNASPQPAILMMNGTVAQD